ncbi:PREDICTED: IRK-interacting protein-like isoform X2 [Nelumbo nucifera]|uniref:IRK-interacting protein-like isoform X2 n=1 Tax=Nelumbo nucifera TaxID=4432 RepID=A0A1U8ARZ7_NELNU|nr:PREDICTED: IRK-interacting protein-like isoform X2 [Nelumbo nucifera]
MAAATTTAAQTFQNNNNNLGDVSREDIQLAIAKAVELRAFHASLMQGNSPVNFRFPSSVFPPLSRPLSQFSAQDYPVFTPSYEEEPLPAYQHFQLENRTLSEYTDAYGLEVGDECNADLFDNLKDTSSSRKGFPSGLFGREPPICQAEDHKSVTSSCTNHISSLQTSSDTNFLKSRRRTGSGDFKSVTTCNRCKPAIITSESENGSKGVKNSNSVVPLTDSHLPVQSQPKNKGAIMSWLFPRLKKKHKKETSPNRTESEEVSQSQSQMFRELGIMSVESLKKELIEANEHRDAALMEVSEMKSSLVELKQKLEYLESYCEELKKALKQSVPEKEVPVPEKSSNLLKRGKSADGNSETLMPVSHEVMVEGFLQIVSEARLSVKQLCKTLVEQIEETDSNLVEKLNLLLEPYKLALNSKYSKAVFYHLEAIINQSLFQDFENCTFQKNGSPKILDPKQDRQAKFASFVALRNLSWNEVLHKGTKYYSEEFSRFCDHKMSCIISTLHWTRPWSEQLLQSFFVTAKCIWLLHLLAFSFNPPLGILRVEENRSFDSLYMEDIFNERKKSQTPSRVKIMVMPGFYVQDRVLRCKVLCKYKSLA